MKNPFVIAGLSIVTILVLFFGITYLVTKNKDAGLRNEAAAQQRACALYYDEVWKVLKQKAQVADQYKDAFKEIYPSLINGRYGDEKGGTLIKMIKESNPDFNISLYKDLSAAIESERRGFRREQDRLSDIKREHDDLRTKWPTDWFMNKDSVLTIVIITSDVTENVYNTGKENDINLFDKK